MRRGIARLAGVMAACSAAGCGVAAPRSAPPAPSVAGARYEVRVVSTAPWVLAVELTVVGGADRLVACDGVPASVQAVEVDAVDADARSSAPARAGAQWPLDCRAGCTVRYRIDLSEAARASGDDPAVALRSGGDVVVPASTWLLRPEPLTPHVPIDVVVHDAPGARFASGFASLRGCGAGGAGAGEPCAGRSAFGLRSEELRTAGYTAFGSFTPLRAGVHGGAVDIAVLGGERAVDDDAVVRWVGRMAGTLDPLFGRFPVPRAQLFIVPEPGAAAPTWGRTLPSGGLSVLLTVGARAREDDLDRDWILVHEMIHLGVPSFWREGRWLDEGLATYYEPVLRTRAGLRSPLDLWTEFATQMPLGQGAPGEPSLVDATLHARVYWGGASFALRADARIRSRTGGARSLDDGIRAALERGGDATRIWSLDAYLGAIDDAVGVPVMRELYARASEIGVPVCGDDTAARGAPRSGPRRRLARPCSSPEQESLAGLLRDLGIDRGADGVVALRDVAPLSGVRDDIARGAAR